MEENRSEVMKQLDDITECCICLKTYIDPRMLPCIHTFCLECLRQTGSNSDKKSGDRMPCPVCRTDFAVPDEGFAGLQKNFFMERLIEMTGSKNAEGFRVGPLCDLCRENGDDADDTQVPSATKYCVECKDNLCDDCVKHHKKHKLSRNHQCIEVGEQENENVRMKNAERNCDKHPTKLMDVYCEDCGQVVCVSCLLAEHVRHEGSCVSDAAEEFRRKIAEDVDRTIEHSDELLKKMENLCKTAEEFIKRVTEVENSVLQRSRELKEMIDRKSTSLLEELSRIKENRLKILGIEKEEVQRRHTILTSFSAYCKEIQQRGSAGDICRLESELHSRTEELMTSHLPLLMCNTSFGVSFRAAHVEEAIFGAIEETVNRKKKKVPTATLR